MATVIDTLLVELGLDPSKFNKQQADALEHFKKMQEQTHKVAKAIEDNGKKAIEFFSRLRDQVLGLYALFTTGRGLKEFTEDVTAADTQLGRTARTMGVSVEELDNWQQAVERAGGSADGVAQSMRGWQQELEKISATGQSELIPFLRPLGINLVDINGKARDVGDTFVELAGKLQGMRPSQAFFFGKQTGLDEGTIQFLMRGPKVVAEYLAATKKLGLTTKDDVAAAEEREKAWHDFLQVWTRVGKTILTDVTPALLYLMDTLKELAEWAKAHPAIVEAAFYAITAAVTVLSSAMAIGLAAGAVGKVIEAFGVLKVVFLAFRSISIVGMLVSLAALTETALPALASAFVALGVAIEATPIGWILTGIAAVIGVGYLLYENWSKIARWWHSLWGGMGADAKSGADRVAGTLNVDPRKRPGTSNYTPGAPFATTQSESDIQRLMARGWSRAQATGIVANIQRESSGSTTKSGDQGSAYGLAQWHPDRQAAFKQWSGHDIRSSNREEQLAFIDYELRNGSDRGARNAGRALAGSTDAADAARIISRLYERPGDATGEASLRAALASALAAKAPAGVARLGSAASAAAASNTYNNRSSTSTSTTEVKVGEVNIVTPATDAAGIAKEIGPAIERDSFAKQANYGPN